MTYNQQLEILLKQIYSFAHLYDNNDTIMLYCPKCQHHKPKLGINTKKELYHCFVCNFKGKGIEGLLKRTGKQQFIQQLKKLKTDFNMFLSLLDNEEEQDDFVITLPESYTCFFNNNTQLRKNIENYAINYLLNKRKLSIEKIIWFKIGFDYKKQTIIIPSFDYNGYLNYYIERGINNKYVANPPLLKKNMIFNEIYFNYDKPTILVEGPFDSLKMLNKFNIIPLLGSSINIDWLLFKRLYESQQETILLLDNDETGKKQTENVGKLLLEYFDEFSLILLPKNIKDPGEFNVDDKIFEKYIEDNKIKINDYSKLLVIINK